MIAELDRQHVQLLLETQHVGRIGCHANGRTYVVPVTYVYDDGYVYGHANEGLKVDMMRSNPEICFEVDRIEDFTRWQSVIAWGHFEELAGEDAAKALDLLLSRLGPEEKSETSLPDGADGLESMSEAERRIRLRATKGITYRLKIDEASGRYETH